MPKKRPRAPLRGVRICWRQTPSTRPQISDRVQEIDAGELTFGAEGTVLFLELFL